MDDDEFYDGPPEPTVYRLHAVPVSEIQAPGYWCVVCMRLIEEDDSGALVHDDVPHPSTMTFDEDARPQ